MRQHRREHPLMFGQQSEAGSENSSRLQAEVQRKMEEYTNRYQEEVQRLQLEVQQLRRERNGWFGGVAASQSNVPMPPGNATQSQGNLPQQANLPPQPVISVPVPQGNERSLQEIYLSKRIYLRSLQVYFKGNLQYLSLLLYLLGLPMFYMSQLVYLKGLLYLLLHNIQVTYQRELLNHGVIQVPYHSMSRLPTMLPWRWGIA